MVVLGIETATRAGSVALVREGESLAEYLVSHISTHSEWLLKGIDQILSDAGMALSGCDAIAVSIGPGSFTGLRIGVSTAKALAYAIHKPILGISTLEALSYNLLYTPHYICPMIDARKNEVFTALYQWIQGELKVLIPERAIPPLEMIHQLDCSQRTIFPGNGSFLYGKLIQAEFGAQAEFPPPYHNLPRASIVAGLGLSRLTQGQRDSVETLVPKYLRLSDAEISWVKNHGDQTLSH
ncbi:MAG: tRNA (adenosine(37)-N6)-threonylcarbamoyltransferase complex dimerization subunit type 1 TsaB [bacterium]